MKLLKITLLTAALSFFAVGISMAQGTVSGVVFNDSNGNGTADAGETVAPGTVVTLLDEDGNPIPGVPPIISDDQGRYSFTVPPGDYILQFTFPGNVIVRTQAFTVTQGGNLPVDVPVVTRDPSGGFNNLTPNLSVVNAGATRGEDVSPFR